MKDILGLFSGNQSRIYVHRMSWFDWIWIDFDSIHIDLEEFSAEKNWWRSREMINLFDWLFSIEIEDHQWIFLRKWLFSRLINSTIGLLNIRIILTWVWCKNACLNFSSTFRLITINPMTIEEFFPHGSSRCHGYWIEKDICRASNDLLFDHVECEEIGILIDLIRSKILSKFFVWSDF